MAMEDWGTRVGLVLAMAGSAVGLGSFPRIPALAARGGGGVLPIPSLVSFLLIGNPLLRVQWTIGRHFAVPLKAATLVVLTLFAIKSLTPEFIGLVFLTSPIQLAGEWATALSSLGSGGGWPLAGDGVIGKLLLLGEGVRWLDVHRSGAAALVVDITQLLLTLVFTGCAWKLYKGRELALEEGRP